MDPSSNFSSYRSTLKAAMWRSAGATDERQRIVVPFFSLLVKDLYFLNEGCSNKWVKTLDSSIDYLKALEEISGFIKVSDIRSDLRSLSNYDFDLETETTSFNAVYMII